MNRTTRRTIITLAIIAIVAVSWYAIRHTDKYGKYNYYYGRYDAVSGLGIGGPVYYKGVAIGKVKDIELSNTKVVVTFAIQKRYPVPTGSSAMLLSGGLMGSKDIRMVMGAGPGAVQDGAWIQTTVDTGLLDNANAVVTPMLHTAQRMLGSFDTTLVEFTQLATGGLLTQTNALVIGLDENTKSFAQMAVSLNRKSPQITALLNKLQAMVNDPTGKNRSINQSISKAQGLTQDLANADVQKNLASIRSSMQSLRKVSVEMNDPSTSIGKLNTDKTAYLNASNQLAAIDTSLKETMADPPGISIFGGSKKKKSK